MTLHEIAEVSKDISTYELAAKTIDPKLTMNDTEKEVAEHLDEWARKIGETGHDPNHEIAAFVTRTVNQEFYDAPDELLDQIFERGSIGEFDDYEAQVMPVKNTLLAYEAAKGGNVPKSYLDYSYLKPTWKNRQVETGISFRDLRRNGWKSVALMTEYATKALTNAMFYDIFSVLDAAIASGAENFLNETGATPSQATMDALALYINDRADGAGVAIALSKYIQAASKLNGFVSEEMKNEVHRVGRLGTYDGVTLRGISSAQRQGNGSLLIPDKRIYGIAGKVGTLDMKGEVHTYETEETNKEVIDIKVADFTYGYSFNKDTLENVFKVVLA